MKGQSQVLFFTLLITCLTLGQKNADEGRPYEFGFTIDGEQHRHEKKDERGIIQGEFGFITADGIYHVTVYATDENGDFKILSMRNLRISAPLDGSSFKGEISPEANKYRKQANLPPLPAAQPAPNALSIPEPAPQPVVATSKPPFRFTTPPTVKPACAGCGYVTTLKPTPFKFQQPLFQKQDQQNKPQNQFGTQNNQQHLPALDNYQNQPENFAQNNQYQPSFGTQPNNQQELQGQQEGFLPQNVQGLQNQAGNFNQNNQYQPISDTQQNNQQGQEGLGNQGGFIPQNVQDSQNYVGGSQDNQPLQIPIGLPQGSPPQYHPAAGPQSTNYKPFGGSQGTQIPPASGNYYGNGGSSLVGGSGSPQGNGLIQGEVPQPNPLQLPGQGPATGVSNLPPVSVSDSVIHVGGNRKQDIPIKDKFPGMQEGLPAGIEEKDITDLLYKFHYTVGFHGHYEKGLKNGAKIGGYFVNGRDGISRVVTYIADENGYRPKVKFINLGLESDETPKAETEKTFGLKSFEFVWYPI